jgi:myosin heavy subunit
MMKQASFEILADLPEPLEAHASLFGDHVMWLKFIFTDDGPNANNQGIRQEEFDNIISTGRLKPFKKMKGSIADGHDEAVPIGTIASLEKVENRIEAIAAIWEREFPEDVQQIQEAYANEGSLNVSWELIYQDEVLDQYGVSWLKDVSTRAATLVNMPAYEGRTPILAVAAKTVAKEKDEGDSSMELEQLKAQLEVKEEKLSAASEELDNVKTELDETKASLEDLQQELKELEELRQFKEQVETDRARMKQLDTRFKQVAEAGIEMSREDFDAEAERWLGMDEEAFGFVLKMLINTPTNSSEASASAPPMSGGNESNDSDPLSIFKEFLKERKNSEESE